MFKIVAANREDLTEIKHLAELIWWPTYQEYLSKSQISFMLEKMYSIEALQKDFQEGFLFFLVQNKLKNVGFMACNLLKTQAKIRIEKLYILPEFQGQNLGKLFILKAEELAKQNQCKIVELNVNRNNKALFFYEKQGFTIDKITDFPFGDYVLNDYVLIKEV